MKYLSSVIRPIMWWASLAFDHVSSAKKKIFDCECFGEHFDHQMMVVMCYCCLLKFLVCLIQKILQTLNLVCMGLHHDHLFLFSKLVGHWKSLLLKLQLCLQVRLVCCRIANYFVKCFCCTGSDI